MQQVQMPIYLSIATKDNTLRIVVHGTMPAAWNLLASARMPVTLQSIREGTVPNGAMVFDTPLPPFPSLAVSTIQPVVGGTPPIRVQRFDATKVHIKDGQVDIDDLGSSSDAVLGLVLLVPLHTQIILENEDRPVWRGELTKDTMRIENGVDTPEQQAERRTIIAPTPPPPTIPK
jgi:hypothetical protein